MQDGDGEEVQHWLQEAVQECDREGLLGLHRLQAAQLPLRAQTGVQGMQYLVKCYLLALTFPHVQNVPVEECHDVPRQQCAEVPEQVVAQY